MCLQLQVCWPGDAKQLLLLTPNIIEMRIVSEFIVHDQPRPEDGLFARIGHLRLPHIGHIRIRHIHIYMTRDTNMRFVQDLMSLPPHIVCKGSVDIVMHNDYQRWFTAQYKDLHTQVVFDALAMSPFAQAVDSFEFNGWDFEPPTTTKLAVFSYVTALSLLYCSYSSSCIRTAMAAWPLLKSISICNEVSPTNPVLELPESESLRVALEDAARCIAKSKTRYLTITFVSFTNEMPDDIEELMAALRLAGEGRVFVEKKL